MMWDDDGVWGGGWAELGGSRGRGRAELEGNRGRQTVAELVLCRHASAPLTECHTIPAAKCSHAGRRSKWACPRGVRYDDVGRYREHPHGDEGGCLGEGCSDEGGKGGVPITPQWLHISTLPTLQWDIRGYVMIALGAGRPTQPRCPSMHAYTPSNRCVPLPLSLSLPLSPAGQPGLREGHTGRPPARDDPRQVCPCSLLEGVDGGGVTLRYMKDGCAGVMMRENALATAAPPSSTCTSYPP